MPLVRVSNGGTFSETLLWSNPSPTVSYSSGTVNLSDNVTNYDYIKVTFRSSTTKSLTRSLIFEQKDWINTRSSTGDGTSMNPACAMSASGNRNFYWASNTSITFGTCTTTKGCIPYAIYGLK